MARGFLSGIIWGGVVGVGFTVGASVLSPPPMPPEVSDVSPGSVTPPTQAETSDSGENNSTQDPAPETGLAVTQGTAPDPDTIAAMDSETFATAAQPDTGDASGLSVPDNLEEQVDVALKADAPVLPNPLALAPMEPQAADELSISTEPAQPPAPAIVNVEGAFDPVQEPEVPVLSEETAERADPSPETPVQLVEQPDETVEIVAEEISQEPPILASAPVEPSGEQPEVASLQPVPDLQPIAPPAAVLAQSPLAPEADEATTATAEEVESSSEVIVNAAVAQPSAPLTERAGSVIIRRPGSAAVGQIGSEDAITVASDEGTAIAVTDNRPIARFAQDYENNSDKPLMAIVLIDNGTSPVTGAAGIAALRSFPYPLSFAVDANLSDAADRMATYRAAGFEVLVMIDLPEGALPSDAETTFGAILPIVPDVVGVLEGTNGGLQGSRAVADQVTTILGQTGHGLLTQDKGLNTMPKLARKAGVPADPVFRDFDSKGQTATVIRRFLDQAAFKAGQEGAVVMLGRMRPDTISALLLWGLQDRAGKVALVPISAVLLREE